MKIIADLHLHSKYSRAVSSQMVIPEITRWAKIKGIDLLAAPDWTHPLFLRELKEDLIEVNEGVYAWKEAQGGARFLLVTEISSIYSQNGQTRKIHNLVMVPSFEAVENINAALRSQGANLLSDGRPITGLSSIELCDLIFSAAPESIIIPAHVWTPWFSLYGSKSGFDSLNDCYGQFAGQIKAIETGLSSDPAMNWRIGELDNRAIVSFSDAHSPAKMGRETTVFEIKSTEFDYRDIKEAFQNIAYTIEFYPEEGKYHYTGHRNCEVVHSPEETKKLGETCPVCGRGLTVGVLHRVEKLATRSKQEVKGEAWEMGQGVKGVKWGDPSPYVMLVPLQEILSEALESGVQSQKVQNEYQRLTGELGSEFEVLLNAKIEDIARLAGEKAAEAVRKVRAGDLVIDPGYDGAFGKVRIWKSEEEKTAKKQMSLF
jgi:uncharacterized protein (TIGR00375 family)